MEHWPSGFFVIRPILPPYKTGYPGVYYQDSDLIIIQYCRNILEINPLFIFHQQGSAKEMAIFFLRISHFTSVVTSEFSVNI